MHTIRHRDLVPNISFMTRIKGFTLIELIMVMIIIGILVVTALPRYYASVTKAKRNKTMVTLASIKDTILSYYSAYGAFPTVTGPSNIIVTVDGDAVASVGVPTGYYFDPSVRPTIYSPEYIPGCIGCLNVVTGIFDCNISPSYPECN